MVYMRIDTVLVASISGPKDAARYAVAFSIVLLIAMAPGPIMNALMPAIARASGAGFRELISMATTAIAGVAVLGAVLGISSAGNLLQLVATSDFRAASTTLTVLFFAAALGAFQKVAGFASVARGSHRPLLLVALVVLSVNVILNAALIPTYGIEGSATAFVLSEGVSLAATWTLFLRASRIGLPKVRPVVACLIAGGISWLAGQAGAEAANGSGAAQEITVTSVVVVLTYVGVLRGTRVLPPISRFFRAPTIPEVVQP
jgi:O-antigen/teichoic acid export membrane protein